MEDVGVVIDKILDYLSDNQWGGIGDLTRLTGLEVDKVSIILAFLEEFDFVSIDPEEGRVRLTDSSTKIIAPRIEAFEEVRPLLKRVP